MAESRKVRGLAGLQQAFDEVRFGAARTLNLRESLPSGARGGATGGAWLRQQQVQQSGELLVITGRGNNSESGIAVVREATLRVFHELRRKGVVAGLRRAHAGLVRRDRRPDAAGARRQESRREQTPPPPPPAPPTLAALDESTRERLRVLAERSLDAFGVRERGPFVESEMLRLFGEPRARASAMGPTARPAARRDRACDGRARLVRGTARTQPAPRCRTRLALDLARALRAARTGLHAQSAATPRRPCRVSRRRVQPLQRALEDDVVRASRARTPPARTRARSRRRRTSPARRRRRARATT